MFKLAERLDRIPRSKASESLRIREQYPDIISLGAGEPDFPTPPNVIEAVKRRLDEGFTHYAPPLGKVELREEIAKKLKNENKIDVDPDEVIVSCGSKESILLCIAALTNPGDEVIVPDPGYLAFRPICEFMGAKAVSLHLKEEDRFEMHAEELEKLVSPKTRVIIINSPSNPTGTVLKRKCLEEIGDIVIDKDLIAISDEAYEKLVYDDVKHISMGSLKGMAEHVITTQSFSKTYAMCGFRVGYAAGPSEIIREIEKLKLCTTISSPAAFQMAAIDALRGSKKYVEEMVREYDRRRKMFMKMLDGIPQMRYVKPQGAFYMFPNITGLGMSSEEAFKFFVEKAKVFTVPGTEFGKYGEGYVRMSYATAYEKIEEAMDRIEKAIKTL